VSTPPGRPDRHRWARLLVAAEVARRGGTAEEVERDGRVLLRVGSPGGGAHDVLVEPLRARGGRRAGGSSPRVVVDAAGGAASFRLVGPDGDAGWDLLGL
jgi:hypothetical protein